jgi:hypothetical protein
VLGRPRDEDDRDKLRREEGPAVLSPCRLEGVERVRGVPVGLFRSTTVGSRGIWIERGDLLGAEALFRFNDAERVMW